MKPVLLSCFLFFYLHSFSQPTAGLVAHYNFLGNANDISGNGNNAIVHGATLTTDQFGNANEAYLFNGVSDFIELPVNTLLLNNYTYSVCVKPTSIPASAAIYNAIISIGSVPADQYLTIANSPTTSQVGFACGSYYAPNVVPPDRFSVGSLPIVNSYYHIVVTRSDTTLKMFINGILINTVTTHTILPSYGNGVFSANIGCRAGGVQFFQGVVDDVSIYNRALSDSEVQAYTCSTTNLLSISGVINDYTPVTSLITCNSITVQNASAFSAGDRALIIQMQGAIIDSISNNSNFGKITGYASAGNYEFNTITQVNGTTISFQSPLMRQYSVNGRVQLVRVPQYGSVNVTGVLTCLPWNGSIGGILAFEATDTVNLNSQIDVSGKGFRGGLTVQSQVCPGCADVPNYFYPLSTAVTGTKGEGIFINTNPNLTGGKGAIANGGGSGGCKNGGGGGGSNIGDGGIGGFSFNGCGIGTSPISSGIGGYSLDSVASLNKVFLGGGGGGGDSDDPIPEGTDGTSGGGIVIVKANTLIGNGQSIFCKGADQLLVSQNDGSGGGGAGGSVLLDISNYSGVTNVIAKGGNGGNDSSNVTGYCHAPGGGGGGGLVWFKQAAIPVGVVATVLAGSPGNILNLGSTCSGTTYGAGAGAAGSSLFNLQFPTLPIIVTVLNSNAPLCLNDTLNLFVNTITGATYNWTGPNGFNSVIQNPNVFNFSVNDTGYYFVHILFNGCTYATDSILVNSFSTAPAPLINSNSPLCEGDTIHLSASLINGATYSWTGPGGFQSNLQNPVINNVQPADSGNYFLTIQLNGCNSLPDTLLVVVHPTPATPVINFNSPLCAGDTITFTSNAGSANYSWSGPNGFQSAISNPIIANAVLSDSGLYNLYVDVNGCKSDTAHVNIVINPVPNAPIVNSNSPVCEGDTVQFSTNPQNNIIYSWTGPNGFISAIPNPFIVNVTSSNSGIYYLTLQDNTCHSLPDSTNVIILTVPVFTPLSNVTICEGEKLSINLTSSNNSNYNWTGPNGFTSSNPTLNIDNIGLANVGVYTLTITNICGTTTDSLVLALISSAEFTFIPNCFTPNQDGRNDVYAIDSIQQFDMLIYNRWGELITELNQNKNSWDGTFSGKNCTEGVYFYLFEGKDCKGSDIKKTGHITILR